MQDVTEEWRPVVGFEGYYEVSNLGRVRGLDRIIWTQNQHKAHARHVRGRLLTPGVVRCYLAVCLSTQDGKKLAKVHVLVAEAFHGPRPAGMHVCHNDGQNFNNHADNLRYDTPKANVADSVRMGRRIRPLKTHCGNGHQFTPENTGEHANRRRYCRICANRRNRQKYRRDVLKAGGNLFTEEQLLQKRLELAGHGAEMQRQKTHCPRNHEYTVENTRMYQGRRHCRACDRLRGSRGTRRSLKELTR